MNNALNKSNLALNTGARGELRLRAVCISDTNPELSEPPFAAELGMSLSSVNHALQASVERCFLKADNLQKSGNEIAYLCALTPEGAAKRASLATEFVGRKLDECDVLRREIEVLGKTSDRLVRELALSRDKAFYHTQQHLHA